MPLREIFPSESIVIEGSFSKISSADPPSDLAVSATGYVVFSISSITGANLSTTETPSSIIVLGLILICPKSTWILSGGFIKIPSIIKSSYPIY